MRGFSNAFVTAIGRPDIGVKWTLRLDDFQSNRIDVTEGVKARVTHRAAAVRVAIGGGNAHATFSGLDFSQWRARLSMTVLPSSSHTFMPGLMESVALTDVELNFSIVDGFRLLPEKRLTFEEGFRHLPEPGTRFRTPEGVIILDG